MEINRKKEGTIFDFKRFATGDGPGVRGLVFLKGCPLECRWCANPESQDPQPEIMYHREKCNGSGRCFEACPYDAIEPSDDFGLEIDSESCKLCGDCIEACPYNALEMVGEKVTVAEMIDRIRNDRSFYDNSDGGVTLTGGEPLQQCEFTRELLKACKSYNIHTAIETTGYTSWECFKSVLPYLDLVFNDFKHLNSDLHEEYTGVDNKIIKENLEKISEEFTGDLIVRIPYIPGHNDFDQLMESMFQFISELGSVKRVEIMPYHRLGITKYHGTGRNYELEDIEPVNANEIEYLTDIGERYGLDVRIDAK